MLSSYEMLKALSVILGLIASSLPLSAQPVGSEDDDSTQATEVKRVTSTQWVRSTRRVLTPREIRMFPFRGIQNYLPLLPGVVQQNGKLHIRGGRAGEVAYFLDGVPVTNRFFNNEGVTLIPEAIDRIDVYTGAYDAEYGGANGGLVQSKMRTGGETFQYSFSAESDDFAKPGKEFLGTTAFGYRNVVGIVSGPLPFEVKMFLAAEHHYLRNRQSMFLEPFRTENLVTDQYSGYPPGTPLPGAVDFKRNHLPNNWYWKNTLQGNLNRRLNPQLELRFTGSYSVEKNSDGGNWPAALENYFRQRRNMQNETRTSFAALQAFHTINREISYKVTLSLYDRSSRLQDPDFGDEWQLYSDSLANAQKGYTGFRSRFREPYPYSTINFFRFKHPNAPNTIFRKNKQKNLSASLDVTSNLTDSWEIQAGVALEFSKMRYYSIRNIPLAMEFLYGVGGRTPRTFPSEDERRVRLALHGNIDFYGYDVDGREVETGLDGPRKPRFISFYIQNRIQCEDFSLSFGTRYEVFDLRMPMPPDINNPPMNDKLYWLDESKFVEQEAMSVLLPRMSTTIRLSETLRGYLAYGKYAQMPAMVRLFLSPLGYARSLFFGRGAVAFLSGVVPGFVLKPEKSTHYEAGISYQIAPHLAFSVASYVKDLRDQAQLGFFDTVGVSYPPVVFVNDGAGFVKGIEFRLKFETLNRLRAFFSYTLSEANGKTSDPMSNSGSIANRLFVEPLYPSFTSPLEYDQTHRGALVVDYRFQPENGSLLDGTGITLLLTFNSGRRYTKEEEIRYLGCAATPWNIGVRSIMDPRAVRMVEPPNSSRTPSVFTLDLRVSKAIQLGPLNAEFYLNILNLLNTKHVLNVYPTTGRPDDDSWFRSPVYEYFSNIPGYEDFYRIINLRNRWAYMGATGNDIYGSPRQIRLGLRLEK